MKQYVAGFYFVTLPSVPDEHHVLLVRKNNPDWQRGLWNGVGGKVEKYERDRPGAPRTETDHIAEEMAREFLEETGIQTLASAWHRFAIERCESPEFQYEVHFYTMHVRPTKMPVVPPHNDVLEALAFHKLARVFREPVVGNLRWLLPLARDWRGVTAIIETPVDIKHNPSW